MNNTQDLERRVADMEARQQLLIDALLAIGDEKVPEGANFPLWALNSGLTAQDIAALNQFCGWAVKRGSENVTREELIREFGALLPHRQHDLETIMRAHRADNQFPGLCKLFFSENDSE